MIDESSGPPVLQKEIDLPEPEEAKVVTTVAILLYCYTTHDLQG